MHYALVKILCAFVCYRPDVGYVQGMSYLAAMFLLNMSPFNAFVALANMMDKAMYVSFFRMTGEELLKHLSLFNACLAHHLPNLSASFKNLGIEPHMYLTEWFMTVFSRSLPMDISHRIWDNFLLYGRTFLFRTALGLLRSQENMLISSSFEDCLQFLNHPFEISDTVLFANIAKIHFTEGDLRRMIEKQNVEQNTGKLAVV